MLLWQPAAAVLGRAARETDGRWLGVNLCPSEGVPGNQSVLLGTVSIDKIPIRVYATANEQRTPRAPSSKIPE